LTRKAYQGRAQELGEEMLPSLLRLVLLETIDRRWKDHIDFMDTLRRGIGFEGMGQRDPKLRFKEEGYRHFQMMYELIRKDVAQLFFRLQVRVEGPPGPGDPFQMGGFAPRPPSGRAAKAKTAGNTTVKPAAIATRPAPGGAAPGKPGPEDPCPCGSGDVYKNCHGKV
jgi:preprotein translocase subunit SecA